MKRGYADIPEGQIHYRTEGQGKSLLLLHMASSSSAEYNRLIPLLSPYFRVIAPDLLGQGLSDFPPRQYEIPEYAGSIVSFMDALGLDRVSIYAHKAATQLAAEIAVARPNRVEKAVLSGPAYRKDHPRESAQRMKIWWAQRVEVSPNGSHLMKYWRRAARWEATLEVTNERTLDYFLAGPRGEEYHWASFRCDIGPKLPRIKCPVLVLSSSDDPFLPVVDEVRNLIPGSRVIVLEAGGTHINRTHPQEVAGAILPFLRE